MHYFATPAHCLPIANNATLLRWQAAVVLRAPVGEDSVATDACGIRVCTNVPAHIVVVTLVTLLLLPGHLADGDQLEEEEQYLETVHVRILGLHTTMAT